ncbi:hypothetical protein, partial [Natronomonas sp.]|uniref:hypothetical protein n=1 Tax=Natronomonas sp. TaxID=2184060 RepID=UPI00398A1ADE
MNECPSAPAPHVVGPVLPAVVPPAVRLPLRGARPSDGWAITCRPLGALGDGSGRSGTALLSVAPCRT